MRNIIRFYNPLHIGNRLFCFDNSFKAHINLANGLISNNISHSTAADNTNIICSPNSKIIESMDSYCFLCQFQNRTGAFFSFIPRM